MREYMKNIVGNAALKQKLCDDIIRDKLPHALIIEGARGTGKHTFALQTAAALACESKNDNSAPLPCGSCQSCKKILNKLCCDVITVDVTERQRLALTPYVFSRKTYTLFQTISILSFI